jgi:RNA recognition motif-containing protein
MRGSMCWWLWQQLRWAFVSGLGGGRQGLSVLDAQVPPNGSNNNASPAAARLLPPKPCHKISESSPLSHPMESSRIFVRGLPPNYKEDDVRKHFAKFPVTDVKFFPQRRIGYVGYKTPEDAVKAVKYFNKSFVRMSKISVEIARPVSISSPSGTRNANAGRSLTRRHGDSGRSNTFPKRLPMFRCRRIISSRGSEQMMRRHRIRS